MKTTIGQNETNYSHSAPTTIYLQSNHMIINAISWRFFFKACGISYPCDEQSSVYLYIRADEGILENQVKKYVDARPYNGVNMQWMSAIKQFSCKSLEQFEFFPNWFFSLLPL